MAAENKILRIFLGIGRIWTKKRWLFCSNNTENSAKIDDLSAKKAKNTPQPQKRCKTLENVKKRCFFVFQQISSKNSANI